MTPPPAPPTSPDPQTMAKWVCQAVLDSLTVFFLPMAAYRDATTLWAERGYGEGLFVFGTTVYAGLIMAMMMKVFNMTNVRSRPPHVSTRSHTPRGPHLTILV